MRAATLRSYKIEPLTGDEHAHRKVTGQLVTTDSFDTAGKSLAT
jgi:hypothetical protein